MIDSGKVIKFRITPENISQFKIFDTRTEKPEYIADRKSLEQKMIDYEKGIKDELTKKYPERYDLTVLTYTQFELYPPYVINDGCHRIEALRKTLFPQKLIDGFTFWLIPTNIPIPSYFLYNPSEKDAYKLNNDINKKLKRAGLPLWVKKFDFCDIDDKLVAWKNINIIDTGDINAPLQFGVDWKLNEGIYFADGKELDELPHYKDLIK